MSNISSLLLGQPSYQSVRARREQRRGRLPRPGLTSRRRSAMPRGLTGGTAIVTGGATLIGQAVVRAFHDHGANVAVADIDAEGGTALARELGERVYFSATDIRDDAQIDEFVAQTVERF